MAIWYILKSGNLNSGELIFADYAVFVDCLWKFISRELMFAVFVKYIQDINHGRFCRYPKSYSNHLPKSFVIYLWNEVPKFLSGRFLSKHRALVVIPVVFGAGVAHGFMELELIDGTEEVPKELCVWGHMEECSSIEVIGFVSILVLWLAYSLMLAT